MCPRAHVKVGTQAVSQPDWPAVVVINHYQASQITVGQSGCDTQPDVPTLTCAPGAHVRKTLNKKYGGLFPWEEVKSDPVRPATPRMPKTDDSTVGTQKKNIEPSKARQTPFEEQRQRLFPA
ncbi:hypothetical protein Tco_0346683, partial [Tanacetum coccineum]